MNFPEYLKEPKLNSFEKRSTGPDEIKPLKVAKVLVVKISKKVQVLSHCLN